MWSRRQMSGGTHEGFDVVAAPVGEAGLHLARTNRPDVVLLDLELPGQSRLEIVEAITKFVRGRIAGPVMTESSANRLQAAAQAADQDGNDTGIVPRAHRVSSLETPRM